MEMWGGRGKDERIKRLRVSFQRASSNVILGHFDIINGPLISGKGQKCPYNMTFKSELNKEMVTCDLHGSQTTSRLNGF